MKSEITLAILPFNFSGKQRSAILSNFEEDLAFHFSLFQGLSVLSYYSTAHLSLRDQKQLLQYNISHVVTGDFRYNGDSVIISVQLIEFPNNKIIFNQKLSYTEKEIFTLLDHTIVQVTNTLRNHINHSILSYSYRKPEIELEVYELFLMGHACLADGTPDADLKARSYFEKAISKQPNYARAFSGISSSYFNEWSCQLWDRWEISQRGAKKFALKAIELDENDYVSLSILGRVLLFERDFEQAEYYLRKSLQMNSNDPSILLQLAFSFMFLGFNEEAMTLYKKACKLSPLLEDRYLVVGTTLLFENGEYEKALEVGRKLESNQTYVDFPVYLAAASYYLNQGSEALMYWNQFLTKYQNHIYFDNKKQGEGALAWHININPYKNASKLKPFWDYIKSVDAQGIINELPENGNMKSVNLPGSLIIKEGYAKFTYASKTCACNATKGLKDIANLLLKPHQDIHCLELMGGRQEHATRVNILDDKAKRVYQKKILELQNDIAEAEANNNIISANALTNEYEELISHLSKSLGLYGKSRKVATPVDKARAAVTLRIRDSIKKIAIDHPQLGAHLNNSIKTGILCSYKPENNMDWEIDWN